MDRYPILFCKTTSLIRQDGRNISFPQCFVRTCDGWRAWRHTPADRTRHHIITKASADWDDLLHPLACRCQTPSLSKDNSVTSAVPQQDEPTLMKDCCMSIKKRERDRGTGGGGASTNTQRLTPAGVLLSEDHSVLPGTMWHGSDEQEEYT